MEKLVIMDTLAIKGARQHNLKNISLELPKNRLIVFTGLSGSGKSSLAFDTIYAEGQRRYVESLSAYARQFLGVMDKPDVDAITGLSPAISIDQKTTSRNPRSTVGTVTEIYDYLRLLFARAGHPHCPTCGREIAQQSKDQIVTAILKLAGAKLPPGRKQLRLVVLAPVVRDRRGEFSGLFDNLRAKGFRQVRVDRQFFWLEEDLFLIKTNKHTIDVLIDKLVVERPMLKTRAASQLRSRLADAVEQALTLTDGLVLVGEVLDAGFSIPEKPKKVTDHIYSEKFSCPICNISLPEIEPRSFSFNSPHGACPGCSGIGSIPTVDPELVINPELSITEGGILPFAKMFFHDTWYSRLITAVSRQYGIDPRAPLKQLTAKQREVILYGTGDKVHWVEGTNRFGELTSIEETFSGIIPELVHRHSETESDFLRAEIERYMRQETCRECAGRRLKKESLTITINGFSIAEVSELSINEALSWVHQLPESKEGLSPTESAIASPILHEIGTRLGFLVSVGLGYLTLSRAAQTLAGGEAQRIRLASQIGSGLTGVLYVLDEPSVGLHPRDNGKLIATLKKLRDLGNTVIVVEHDRDVIESADWIIDFGPGAGKYGGQIVAQGKIGDIKNNSRSLTGQFMAKKRQIAPPRRPAPLLSNGAALTLVGVSHHNLKNLDVSFPLGKFVCVTGVSGSGKSSLIVETLYPALLRALNPFTKQRPGNFKGLRGIEAIDKVIIIDQSPIGRTPRSNPATYTGVFSPIRDIFAQLPEAKTRGYKPGRFSFNLRGGRCETCEGEGQRRIEMQFLADIYVTCEVCSGARYNQETLEVTYHGRNIAQVLYMTVDEALEFFHHHSFVLTKLQTMADVGLGYIHLGQPATTLSGGEAERVKLAAELSRRATGRTVYILDEPTMGLHFADLEKLLSVLHRLVASGNTVIVIEHNLDVIKTADWIIDLGPEGGEAGGRVVSEGTPRAVAKVASSYTGQFLRHVLQ